MKISLKAIRKEKGFSQKQVADKAMITQPTYANIENEVRRPSVDTAKLLGAVLEFDWTLLFANEDEQTA